MRATHTEHLVALSAVVPNHAAVWMLHPGDGGIVVHGEQRVSCQSSNTACSLAFKPDSLVAFRRHSPRHDFSWRLASGLDGGGIKRHFSPHMTLVSSLISLAASGQPGMAGRGGWRLARGAPGRSRCSRRLMKSDTTTWLGRSRSIVLTGTQPSVVAIWRVASVWHTTHELRSSTSIGEAAMQHMQSGLRAMGVELRLCEAFAYGTGNMFRPLGAHNLSADKIVRWAQGALEYLGPRVLMHDRLGSADPKLAWPTGLAEPDIIVGAM